MTAKGFLTFVPVFLGGILLGWLAHGYWQNTNRHHPDQQRNSAAASPAPSPSLASPIAPGHETTPDGEKVTQTAPETSPSVRELLLQPDDRTLRIYKEYLTQGRFKQAMALYGHVKDLQSPLLNRLKKITFQTVKHWMEANRFSAVIRLLDLYTQTEHLDYRGFEWLALALEKDKQFEQAIRTLYTAKQKAVRQEDIARLVNKIRASVKRYDATLRFQNNSEAVLALYEYLTHAEPTHAPYFIELALMQIELGQWIGAHNTLTLVLYDPDVEDQARRLLAKIDDEQHRPDNPPESIDIPIQRQGDNFIVQATASPGRTLNLIIDTGASMTVIKNSLVDNGDLNTEYTGKTGRFYTASDVVTAPIYTLDALTVGNQTMTELEISSMALPGNMDGLLGMNFFKVFRFYIDQDKHVLRLYPQP